MAWIPVKSDMKMGEKYQRKVYMVEEGDISTPPDPDYSAAGSVAFTADMTKVYVKDGSGTWTESTTDALALLGLL